MLNISPRHHVTVSVGAVQVVFCRQGHGSARSVFKERTCLLQSAFLLCEANSYIFSASVQPCSHSWLVSA